MADQQSTMPGLPSGTPLPTPGAKVHGSNGVSAEDRRKSIRNAILTSKPETRVLTFMGEEIEVRQPPLSVILEQQNSEDVSHAAGRMILRYVFVPGTNTKVFEETDIDAILRLPFNKDMQTLQNAINELSGVGLETDNQEKN